MAAAFSRGRMTARRPFSIMIDICSAKLAAGRSEAALGIGSVFSREARSLPLSVVSTATGALRAAAKVLASPTVMLVVPVPPLAPTTTTRRPVVTGRWAPAEARVTREATSSLRKMRANQEKNRSHPGMA